MIHEQLAETERRLRELAEPVLAREGLELVLIEYKQQGRRYLLRLTIDRLDRTSFDPPRRVPDGEGTRLVDAGVSIEDCVAVSRALSPLLDAEDLIGAAYDLEVSSPGIDRPLTRPAHYRMAVGRRVRLKTRVPFGGTTLVIAPVVEAGEEGVAVEVRGDRIDIPYRLISRANLDAQIG